MDEPSFLDQTGEGRDHLELPCIQGVQPDVNEAGFLLRRRYSRLQDI
jgi:hypothetical protein